MKLLMITRRVDKDDAQAGFVYNWLKKLAQKVDQLRVICLEKGNSQGLPENIEVFSLGKEKGKNRLREFIRFQIGAIKFIRKVDGVFCHQNPEYTILIAPYAKSFRKKIVCFYGHKHVDWRVRLMTFLANQVVTSHPAGFRVKTKKKRVIGQGIDTDFFKPVRYGRKSERLEIISVGRISPIKDYETLIKAADILKREDLKFRIRIVGIVLLEKHQDYFNKLREMVKKKQLEEYVEFVDGVPQYELVSLYQESDLAVNLCPTGAPDKAVLEAMATALIVLVCNKSFEEYLGPKFFFRESDAEDLARKIINLTKSDRGKIGHFLRLQVVNFHNLDNLLQKIVECF